MKSFAFFFILLQISQSTYSDTLQAKYQNRNIRHDISNVDSLQHNSVNISQSSAGYIESLEKRLAQASDTISNLNSMIGAFSTAIAIIGIFIGILTIGLPIVTYQFGIKPSRDAVENLETTMDQKIAKYLEEEGQKSIENNIDRLDSSSLITRSQANAFFLYNIDSYKLNVNQILKIISVLENGKQVDIKPTIATILLYQGKSYILDGYFMRVLKNYILSSEDHNSMQLFNIAKQYFLTYATTDEFVEMVEMAMPKENTSNPHVSYYNENLSKSRALALLNSENFVNQIDKNIKVLSNSSTVIDYFKNIADTVGLTQEEYASSEFYKQIVSKT